MLYLCRWWRQLHLLGFLREFGCRRRFSSVCATFPRCSLSHGTREARKRFGGLRKYGLLQLRCVASTSSKSPSSSARLYRVRLESRTVDRYVCLLCSSCRDLEIDDAAGELSMGKIIRR